MSILLKVSICFALLSCLTGCGSNTQSQYIPEEGTYPISIGEAKAHLELAITPKEHATGLMHRESLGQHSGIIFLFKWPGQHAFWMKDTSIPLDIGFFDASGKLLETYTLSPNSETPLKPSSQDVLFAIEMNYCWFVKNKVRPGSYINLEDLAMALEDRGLLLEDYPIKFKD